MILFSGETIDFTHVSESSFGTLFQEVINDEVNEKYIKGDVRIVTEQARYPLSSIASLVESNDYELNPEFQRRHRWDSAKKSRLIESFIMNVPIPPIFLYEDTFGHYEVMDGLQRLTAIHEFYKDKYVLEGLEEWRELNGRRYSELPEQVRRGIDRRYLSSIILLQETAKSDEEAQRLKQLVFERINSGGIKLEPQESRNAIYNGPMNKMCIRLARNPYLCKTWGIPEQTDEEIKGDQIPDELLHNEIYRKMDDVELVLRFFAYRQRLENQRGALKEYLDSYLKYGNLFHEDVLTELEHLFLKTIKLVYDTLGERSFWLWRHRYNNWGWLNRPTTVTYDPIMFVFSQHLDDAEEMVKRQPLFQERIKAFYEANYKKFEGRYTNLNDIRDRNLQFDHFVMGVLAEDEG